MKMELDIAGAFFMFFAGALSHIIAVRIFNAMDKQRMYHATFINCLSALKLANDMAQDVLILADPDQKSNVEAVFYHWQRIALLGLRNTIPNHIWSTIAVEDWDKAMRILHLVEQQGEIDEKIRRQ